MKITAPAKLTKHCFKDFAYRNSNIDVWLPEKQPKQSGEVTVIVRTKDQTFIEMAEQYIGSSDPAILKKHTLTLPMVEKLIQDAEANGLCTDGWGNFFFVEDKDDGVSVARVNRDGSRWYADVHRLGRDRRWDAGIRLLVRNVDASKLGRSDTFSLEQAVQMCKEAGYKVSKEL